MAYRYFLIGCVFTISCSPMRGRTRPVNEGIRQEEKNILPRIEGNPLSALPIADSQLEAAWSKGMDLLEMKPPLPNTKGVAKKSALWLREFNDWTRLFFSKRHQLIKQFAELNANEEVSLFSNLLFASIDARFINTLRGILPPRALSKSSKGSVQDNIDLKISMLLNAALAEFQSAGEGLKRAHSLMQVWSDICVSNRTMLMAMIPNYDRQALQKKIKFGGAYLFDAPHSSCDAKPSQDARATGGLLGSAQDSPFYTIRRFHRLPKNSRLEEGRDLEALDACNLSQETMSYDVSWTISPQGASENVKVSWVEAPVNQQKEAKVCLEKVLREMPWQGPQDSNAQVEQVRVCEQVYHRWQD